MSESKSYLLEDDLAFLKDLHHVKLKSTESDILNQLSDLKNQNVSIGNLGGNFNCERKYISYLHTYIINM